MYMKKEPPGQKVQTALEIEYTVSKREVKFTSWQAFSLERGG